jgi:4,5-DOPA dioxygenase extradiol
MPNARLRVMPTIFVSHGAPTLALEDGPARAFRRTLGCHVPRPRAILCVSAHWEAAIPTASGAPRPETIHDFFGFPEALYQLQYQAPGSPELAARVIALLLEAGIEGIVDGLRGLDHGAWVPLCLAYSDSQVPVVQLSVQSRLAARHHLALGRALRPLRAEGVLILGSGGATHNLGDFAGQSADTPELDASPRGSCCWRKAKNLPGTTASGVLSWSLPPISGRAWGRCPQTPGIYRFMPETG